MRTAALVMALVALVAAPVYAGGGGKQDRGTVRVCNTAAGANSSAFVLLNPTDAALASLQATPTQANLLAQGGVVIAPGECFTFQNVAAGNARIVGGFEANGAFPGTALLGDVRIGVTAGQQSQVSIVEQANGSATITGPAPIAMVMREIAFASFGLGGFGLLALAGLMMSRKKVA